MNLLERNVENRMTLDSRTFLECSKRMQLSSPALSSRTLPGTATETMMQNNEQQTSSSKGLTPTPPRITVKRPTPTPPPRRRKIGPSTPNTGDEDDSKSQGQISSKDKSDNLNKAMKAFTASTSHAGDELATTTNNDKFPSVLMINDKSERCFFKFDKIPSTSCEGYLNRSRMTMKDVFVRRPIQCFMDWMINIANSTEVNSWPPI